MSVNGQNENFVNLSEAIRQFRKRSGLSGTELGKQLGVRHSQVSRYETGESTPSEGVLARLIALAENAPERAIFEAALQKRLAFPVLSPPNPEALAKLMGTAGQKIRDQMQVLLQNEPLMEAVAKYWYDPVGSLEGEACELLHEIFTSGTQNDREWIMGNLRNFVEAIRSRPAREKRRKTG